ncbi:RNA-directed DNA polymerase, eukaryota, Reverse transcriptase zinc-binding domain protein [Artemisia annua]|uniref:RNA-directed DNA polymerase, eukaryota, Reverse transcriptase zinc-binding domain protein n=1 Tax=Artemisia annua TaxID=35608 RepID=A0A2U1Q0T0_ARTAN|nr:RNA-directed DNA polymerase, eukaryota, Reverse transcriptase zinc-binding domain protein [Artemisia annua]
MNNALRRLRLLVLMWLTMMVSSKLPVKMGKERNRLNSQRDTLMVLGCLSLIQGIFIDQRQWKWTSNGALCNKGARIILGWNPDEVDIGVISQNAQVMHTLIVFKADKKELFCSFVYAHNRYTHRRELWHNLGMHHGYVRGRSWCLMGDFNSALNLEDKSVGSSIIDISMREFKECVDTIEISDVKRAGLQFTWSQKPKGEDGILKKIDRVLANLEFNGTFVGANALFQPYRISDHSPAILRIPKRTRFKPKPFKFSNLVVLNPRFKELPLDGYHFHT